MPTPVRMPRLGWTMEEGTVLQWYKQEGEPVTEGKPLLEVETDKVNIDVEAPATGILRSIQVGPDQTVAVETVLAIIAAADERLEEFQSPGQAAAAQQAVETATRPPSSTSSQQIEAAPQSQEPLRQKTGRVLASPAARRLAREHGLDLAEVKGSGRGGVASLQDVQSHLEKKSAGPAATVPGKRVALSRLRKTIGRRMQQSFQTAPHFTATVQVDMTKAEEHRKRLSRQVEEQAGGKLTLTAFLVKAVAAVLGAHPFLNALLAGDEVLVADDVHIGVAVALEEGLIVPVIHRANSMEPVEIAASLNELTDKARSQQLSLEEVSGATFTISNLGMFGIDQFTAIINPPQTAILAVGSTVRKPVFVNGQVEGRLMMKMTLSADHRVVDGALVGAFLADLSKHLEEPEQLGF